MFALMDQVMQFHAKMGQPIGDPREPDITVEQDFRIALIKEEFAELQIALAGKKKGTDGSVVPFGSKAEQHAAVADGLGDLFYVLAGSAIVWGIDMVPVMDEIHDSNMSKTPNLHGKAIKGENFRPADLQRVLEETADLFKRDPLMMGENEESIWHTPRKQRVGSQEAEMLEVQNATLNPEKEQ